MADGSGRPPLFLLPSRTYQRLQHRVQGHPWVRTSPRVLNDWGFKPQIAPRGAFGSGATEIPHPAWAGLQLVSRLGGRGLRGATEPKDQLHHLRRARGGDQRCDGTAGEAFLDVPRQIQ